MADMKQEILEPKQHDYLSETELSCTTIWKVFFSSNFIKSLAKLDSNKKVVVHILLRLSKGWRSKRKTVSVSSSSPCELARIYRVGEHFLVWTVDIVKDEMYTQVIKIWDLLLLSDLANLTERLDRVFSMYTETYTSHCKMKCSKGDIEIPISWDTSHYIPRYKRHCPLKSGNDSELSQVDNYFLESSAVSECLLMMKFYALTYGIACHLLTAKDGTELSIPFELSDEEKQVVRFPKSSFILARSGTGKTTILASKLVQFETLHSIASHGVCNSHDYCFEGTSRNAALDNKFEGKKENLLRQVFITVSPKLCLAIKGHVYRLKSFAATGNLDGPTSTLEMHDNSDQMAHFKDIPDSFHDLSGEYLPLVITFAKFLLMLDGTMGSSFFYKFSNKGKFSWKGKDLSKSLALQIFYSTEVNYEKFVGSYWPHFNTHLTKNLDSSIVYSEIISHIKGGFEVGSFLDGKLGRKEYIRLSEKRLSSFCEGTSESIYDIFLAYEKRKCLNEEFDISDFVIDLHQRLRFNAYFGDMFDFVYVDEVQDLTMNQIALLKYVCNNYEEGFFFAGDTAQTISKGINFRFEDIRCLFYKEFVSENKINKHNFMKDRDGLHDIFILNQNFRTHSGILKLAKSIIDLLHKFFPSNIDRIVPEFSLINGESPVWIESDINKNAISVIFGSTTDERNHMIEFGAEQVILVRDEHAKKQILDLIGNKALVLTLLESKGLEFEDVLLYNFFGGSALKHKWRVVYNYMDSSGIGAQFDSLSYPRFNYDKHNLLCFELKQLYVAITRTRQRLWICESSNDSGKPVFDYWKSLRLIQVKHLNDFCVKSMRTESTLNDWNLRGIKLFNEENFEMAMMCFERSGDSPKKKRAEAAKLVRTGDYFVLSDPCMAASHYQNAAKIYESIGKFESAANCYIKYGNYNSAGYCFAMAKNWSDAADAYLNGSCFSKFFSTCTQGELFNTGFDFVKQIKKSSDFNIQERQELDKASMPFLKVYVLHYARLHDITCLVELANVLQSMVFFRKLLKSKNLLDVLLELELAMGNYLEAADIEHLKGNILLEAHLLREVRHFEKSAKLILLYIVVKSLWASGGNSGWPLKTFAEKETLLSLVEQVSKEASNSFFDHVSSNIYVISDEPKDLFNLSKCLAVARKYQDIRLEIFTLREMIDIHLHLEPSKYIWEPGFALYAQNYTDIIISQKGCSVESLIYIWKLWIEKILNVISVFWLSKEKVGYEFELYEEFCFEYFGILVDPEQSSLLMLNLETDWCKSLEIFQVSNNLNKKDIKRYKSSAEQYWRSELLLLERAIMDKLKSMLNSPNHCAEICSCCEVSSDINASNSSDKKEVLFAIRKGRINHAMYEVLNFLRRLDSVSSEAKDKMSTLVSLSYGDLFNILFPVKWNEGSCKQMVDFHRSLEAREILEQSIDKDLSLFDCKLMYGKVGNIVVLLFLTGFSDDIMFNKILMQLMQPWDDLIFLLKNFWTCHSLSFSLIWKLDEALRVTLQAIEKKKCDYMPPQSFIYIVDCLLFCASSSLRSGSLFISSKLKLFEMLRCYGLKGFMEDSFVEIEFNSVHKCLDSIIEMIETLLINKGEVKEWLNSSVDKLEYGYLLSKLVVSLCLANLNSGRTFYLGEFLSKSYILDDLDDGFGDAAAECWVHRQNLADFANALTRVQDSLVIVISNDIEFNFSMPNAIVLNSDELRCRENVIEKLFLTTFKN